MQKRQILLNSGMSLAQVVVISGSLFFLYRYLLKILGVDQLGIWSLVLATTSVTQIANLGLSGSVVKFVAKYVALNDKQKISEIIQTASIAALILVGGVLLAGYPVARWALGLVVPITSLPLALGLLPYSFLGFWLMIATGIFQSGLDGHQRIDIRCWLLMAGAVLQLFLAFLLTPRFGLMGMAYVRIIQNFVILAASWLILRKIVPQLPSIPWRFNRSLFKEMIGYGANFQLIAFLNMFFEPVTKMLLGKFGSLAMVGYYEMANRMIQQVRALLVSANQTIVPAIAGLKEVSPERIRSVYRTSYRLMFYLALPIFSLMIVALPVISFLWIGHIESLFITMGLIIALGWLLNTLNAPAYFVYLGIGELRWNVVSHLLIATLNVGMGFILGRHFGGLGVVSASAIALGIGSAVIIISFNGKNGIPDSDMAPRDSRTVGLLCIVGLGLMFLRLWPGFPLLRSGAGSAIFLMIFFLALAVILFRHPMKGTIIGWVREGFFEAASKE